VLVLVQALVALDRALQQPVDGLTGCRQRTVASEFRLSLRVKVLG